MGDFNFDSEHNFRKNDGLPLENLSLQEYMPKAVDVWSALNADKKSGKTFDSGMFP